MSGQVNVSTEEQRLCYGNGRHPKPKALNRQQAVSEDRPEWYTTCSQPWRPLDDIQRVGALVKKHAIERPLNSDAKEMVKRPRSFIANSRCKTVIVQNRSSAVEAIRMMTST
jgi:hypothetical protein